MRILQVIPSVELSRGGPSVVATELNRAFRRLGHDALILTIGEPKNRVGRGDARVLFSRPVGPVSLELSASLFVRVLRYARNADIIAMDGFYGAHAVACQLASKAFGTPLVIQPHGVFDPEQRKESTTRKRVFDGLTGDRLLTIAGGVHFSSANERATFDRAAPQAELAVVPHGSALPEPRRPASIAGWIDSGGYSRVFCFVGRLAAKKQPDLLIEAWSRIGTPGDACLVVAGSEGDWTVRQLRELARAADAPNIHVTGHLDRGEVAWLLQRSDVFVLPSWEENFGLTILEAMSARCYVITTAAVGAASLVVENQAGRVLGDATIDSVARELQRALDHWDRVEQVAHAHSTTARQSMTWDESARALVALYSRVSRLPAGHESS